MQEVRLEHTQLRSAMAAMPLGFGLRDKFPQRCCNDYSEISGVTCIRYALCCADPRALQGILCHILCFHSGFQLLDFEHTNPERSQSHTLFQGLCYSRFRILKRRSCSGASLDWLSPQAARNGDGSTDSLSLASILEAADILIPRPILSTHTDVASEKHSLQI